MTVHQQVHELAAEGKTQAEIISRLHLHRHTVRTYLRMPTFVAHYCNPHPSPVEPYRTYLEARWQQGEVMIKTLWHELQAQGFTGSYKSVWTFLRTWPLPAGMTPTSDPRRTGYGNQTARCAFARAPKVGKPLQAQHLKLALMGVGPTLALPPLRLPHASWFSNRGDFC